MVPSTQCFSAMGSRKEDWALDMQKEELYKEIPDHMRLKFCSIWNTMAVMLQIFGPVLLRECWHMQSLRIFTEDQNRSF